MITIKKNLKILVIDDEKLICWSFEKKLINEGYQVKTAESGEEGMLIFEDFNPHIVFLDNNLPGIQGIELIKTLKSLNEDVQIVFMTAYESVEVAVKAIRNGASEYIRKPFVFEEIYVLIDKIAEKENLKNELLLFRRQKKEDFTFDDIIFHSESTKQTIQIARKISKTETTTILLLGESGTGKDIFARSIHNESNRKSMPFVTINCSSLAETLLESELFGHEKGAFTDAKVQKKGLFEIADGGTVFLDEIGEINQSIQLKLLGVLENRVVRRLGGLKDIPVNIRIIAATNKDLKTSIINKYFREDLYYRLKVFQIDLLPLRDRKEDIIPLLDYFLMFNNHLFGKKITGFESVTLQKLTHYLWPGNVRELRNVVERAVILETSEKVQLSSLPAEIVSTLNINLNEPAKNRFFELSAENFPDEGISLSGWEKNVISAALAKADYNQSEAARLLDISRDTLRYKKMKYNL